MEFECMGNSFYRQKVNRCARTHTHTHIRVTCMYSFEHIKRCSSAPLLFHSTTQFDGCWIRNVKIRATTRRTTKKKLFEFTYLNETLSAGVEVSEK